MNLRLAEVKASSPFGDVIIPWNNCRPDAEKRDLDGSTERCVLTGLSKNNESWVGGRATVAFCFTSHFGLHQNFIEFLWPY
jgi:hypothetical protein